MEAVIGYINKVKGMMINGYDNLEQLGSKYDAWRA